MWQQMKVSNWTGYWFTYQLKGSSIYLQNSGLGNCVNPIVSLADRSFLSLFSNRLAWRKRNENEPQHKSKVK